MKKLINFIHTKNFEVGEFVSLLVLVAMFVVVFIDLRHENYWSASWNFVLFAGGLLVGYMARGEQDNWNKKKGGPYGESGNN